MELELATIEDIAQELSARPLNYILLYGEPVGFGESGHWSNLNKRQQVVAVLELLDWLQSSPE